MSEALPHWLNPEPYYQLERVRSTTVAKRNQRAIEEHTFEAVEEDALEHIAGGGHLDTLFTLDPRQPHPGRYLAWVNRDPARQSRYYEAQAIGAEVIAQQIIQIADASDSLEDVNRSTLRINTRKWLLGVWSRKRFGDVKQIDQTISIDISGAMRAAQERLDRARTVDVIARGVDGHD